MKEKLKKIVTNWRFIVLMVLVVLSVWLINPTTQTEGVAITSVLSNSSAYNAGIQAPQGNILPRNREVITEINDFIIKNQSDYQNAISSLSEEAKSSPYLTARLVTNKNKEGYILTPEFDTTIIVSNETEFVIINKTKEKYNETSKSYYNVTIPTSVEVNKTTTVINGIMPLGIRIKQTPVSNIRPGLDLEGGTRVMLEPQGNLTGETFDLLKESLQQRLNVYGLADIAITETTDLENNRYLIVEMPGINEEEVKDLISEQGKFEAKVGNVTVFSGGKDIRAVMKTADRSGIDPQQGCGKVDQETWSCRFYFGITLSQESAERQGAETAKLQIITIDPTTGKPLSRDNQFLSGQIDFFLDGKKTDALNIGADLKGRAVTDIQISGSKTGRTEYEARSNALKEMKRMQTLLVTGSLPVEIKIIKSDSISPLLGKTFVSNVFLIGILALLGVVAVTFIRYREPLIIAPIAIIMTAEVIMMMGFAAVAGWNMDLAAIAAIILVIGTGIDHLIILTDETIHKSTEVLSWIDKLKRAFGIILIAGITNIAAMIPLFSAGGGMLKGFALTSIVGTMLGIFIARPVYGAMIEILLKK